jgi:hypothetical protein
MKNGTIQWVPGEDLRAPFERAGSPLPAVLTGGRATTGNREESSYPPLSLRKYVGLWFGTRRFESSRPDQSFQQGNLSTRPTSPILDCYWPNRWYRIAANASDDIRLTRTAWTQVRCFDFNPAFNRLNFCEYSVAPARSRYNFSECRGSCW